MSKVVYKILSGKLFYQYDKIHQWDKLPKTFTHYRQYENSWWWLMEFELMNILLHSRRGDSKQEKGKVDLRRHSMWCGYVVDDT